MAPGQVRPAAIRSWHSSSLRWEHHVCSNWQKRIGKLEDKTQLADFVAEPGKIYYFKTRVVNPTTETLPEFTLEPINPDEGKLLVSSSPMSESKRSK